MEHDGCKGCAYESESVTGKHCVYCEGTKQGDMYKRATNADRIRSMSDEELAKFLNNIYELSDGSITISCKKLYDEEEIMEWLLEEVEE